VGAHEGSIFEVQRNVQLGAGRADLLVGRNDGLAAADSSADGLAGLRVQHSGGVLQLAVETDDAALAVGFNVLGAEELGTLLGEQIAQVLAVLGQLRQVFDPLAGVRILDNGSHGHRLDGLAAGVGLHGLLSAALVEHFFEVGNDLANLRLFHWYILLLKINS